MEPSENDIESICMITGLDAVRDRNLVARALKAKNLNSEAVLNEFFDDETKFRTTYHWDETAFTGEREGPPPNPNIPSFAIHSEGHGVIQGVPPNNWYDTNTGAPSRPPSRTNNRSPIGRMVDMTADRATGPSSREQEDADLQRAIAESVVVSGRQTPQPPPPQETGVMEADTSKPHFGPANRNDYDHNQWAMVTVQREREEPGPLGRRREADVPAFLRCRRTDFAQHRLGSLLTMYHEIPAARNALLRCGNQSESYGYDAEWWRGKPILPAQTPQGGDDMWNPDPQADFSEELHRLMAFLDGTERAYGTADILADLRVQGWGSQELEQDFMDAIRNMNQGTDKIEPFMAQATIVSVVASDDEDGWAREPETADWNFLKSEIAKEMWPSLRTMYNLWDVIFLMDVNGYNVASPETARMAVISKVPQVMTISINADGLPPTFGVPQTFYIDRYLPEHRQEMVKLQVDVWDTRQALEKAQIVEQHLTHWTPLNGGPAVDRRLLSKAAIERSKKRLWQLQAAALWRRHEELRGTDDEFNYLPGTDAVQVELSQEEEELKRQFEAHISLHERKLRDIDARLKTLNSEKEACERLLQNLQQHRTVPSDEKNWHPVHKYTLRGITATPDLMYLCRRGEPDLVEIEGASSSPVDEWWRLGYIAEDAEPIKAERTTFEKAVEETCVAGSNPIFVYASDKALEEAVEPLSEPLKTFLKFDNRIFRQEIAQDVPRDKRRASGGSPNSPPKRLNRSNSVDSMATNQASMGDSDSGPRDASFGIDDQDPFMMGDPPMDVEMQELVDTSDAAPQQQTLTPPDSEASEAGSPLLVRQGLRMITLDAPRLDGAVDGQVNGSVGQHASPVVKRDMTPSATEDETSTSEGSTTQHSPEMTARGELLPFVARPANGKVGGGPQVSVLDMDMDMELPKDGQPEP